LRAREIGVRKVTGALRWQIFTQFITESVLIAFIALVIALGLTVVIKPMILQLNFAQFSLGFAGNYAVYGIFVVFAVVVGIFAGYFLLLCCRGFSQ
jgi:putative ABC transport system permease protein